MLTRHFFFTEMLFVYCRILNQQLVNTVTSDKFSNRLVSGLFKYQIVICYFLHVAGLFVSFPSVRRSLLHGILEKMILYFTFDLRFHVVYSYVNEEDVQVSIWPVCLATCDSKCGVHPVCIHCCQYFFKVTFW